MGSDHPNVATWGLRKVVRTGSMAASAALFICAGAWGQPAAEVQRRAVVDALGLPQVGAVANQQHESFVSLINDPSLAPPAPSAAASSSTRISRALQQFGSELRFGKPTTVSPEGEHVVSVIRALANAKGKTQNELVAEIVVLSDKQVPEAVNFLGFAAEHGVYGASANMARALAFYRAAAASGYQPAVYNLALANAYGRGGPTDFGAALVLLARAASLAPDISHRICGMGAFLSYREGAQASSLRYATDCYSPLAVLPIERAETTPPTPQRLEGLRKTVATGTYDGYDLLARAASRYPAGDRQYLACKYALVNRYRQTVPVAAELRDLARRCVDRGSAGLKPTTVDVTARDQAVAGITAFVLAEVPSLNRLRDSNHFHYGSSVPYLPFTQQDADLFEAVLAIPWGTKRN